MLAVWPLIKHFGCINGKSIFRFLFDKQHFDVYLFQPPARPGQKVQNYHRFRSPTYILHTEHPNRSKTIVHVLAGL
jgi:hypothetical protein